MRVQDYAARYPVNTDTNSTGHWHSLANWVSSVISTPRLSNGVTQLLLPNNKVIKNVCQIVALSMKFACRCSLLRKDLEST